MSNNKDIALVVPTIRENCFVDFCKRWDERGLFEYVDLIVMEDNPEKTFDVPTPVAGAHLSWKDIASQLEENEWIIPRRSDTVRSFAYWWAWGDGYKYIMTLDDDCYPLEDQSGLDLITGHVDAMNNKAKWFNTLNSVKPRGIPFYNVGRRDQIVLNHGLWKGVLDYDAPTQLVSPDPEQFDDSSRIVPNGSYFPMCGMNVMWKSDITVWMYHLLMGRGLYYKYMNPSNYVLTEDKLEKLPFDRFGDIWCGIIMKRLVDLSGFEVTTGTPYIYHDRASDPFKNLMKEAEGIGMNERFWEYIDEFSTSPGDPATMYKYMGEHVRMFSQDVRCHSDYVDYFDKLGKAMVVWADLFLEGRP